MSIKLSKDLAEAKSFESLIFSRKQVFIFNHTGHILFAIAAYLCIPLFWSNPYILASPFKMQVLSSAIDVNILFLVIGCLLPDVDHSKSMLGKYNIFSCFMSHRGVCHTILGCALLSLPFLLIQKVVFCTVFVGAMTHLVADKLYSFFPHRRKFSIRIW